MRDLKRFLWSLLIPCLFALPLSSQARDCSAYDRIADLIKNAENARKDAPKAWRADGEWKTWESMVVKSLQEAGEGKNAATIAKSLRRKMQQDWRRDPFDASRVSRTAQSASGVRQVPIAEKAEKTLQRLQKSNPSIHSAYLKWEGLVKREGLENVRKIPGYHDEPLRGGRAGQRSVRMNQQYRVIYELGEDGKMRVIEITPHDYRLK